VITLASLTGGMKAAPSDPTIPYVVMTTSNLDSLELPQKNKHNNKKTQYLQHSYRRASCNLVSE